MQYKNNSLVVATKLDVGFWKTSASKSPERVHAISLMLTFMADLEREDQVN